MTSPRHDPGEDLGFTAEALDDVVGRVLGGEPAALPLAGDIAAALQADVRVAVEHAHLAMLAAAAAAIVVSPERSPEPDWQLSSEVVPIHQARSRRRGRRTLVAAIAAVLLLTLGSSSALAASQGATPGDPLYGVKRASERISLALHRSPDSKAALHLEFAQRRLDEIEALVADGRDITDLAADFAAELDAAGAAATDTILARLLERTDAHIAHLNEILSRAPEAAQKGLETAIERAERNGERAEQRRIEQQEKKREREQNGGKPDEPGSSGNAPGKGNGR